MRKYNTNSKVQKYEQLKPEQKRVFDMLKEHFPEWKNECIKELCNEILLNGATYFTETPVTMDLLPSGSEWKWRQSNAKVSVQLDVSTFATIIKLNTTKTYSSAPKPPTYKFWLVQVERPFQQHLWFMYCEKGMETIMPFVSETELIQNNLNFDFCDDESLLQALELPQCPSWDALASLLAF